MRRVGAAVATILMVVALAACGTDRRDGVDANPGKGNDGTGSARCGDQ